MTQFKIDWMEKKTTSVGEKWNCNLSHAEGTEEGVTLWVKDWPTVALAQVVSGDLVVKQNGQYTNKTLYPVKASPGATGGVRKPNMERIMEKKVESITAAQENKGLGIKLASTIRMAVDLAIAEKGEASMTAAEIQDEIRNWRAWLWKEWDKNDGDFDPF